MTFSHLHVASWSILLATQFTNATANGYVFPYNLLCSQAEGFARQALAERKENCSPYLLSLCSDTQCGASGGLSGDQGSCINIADQSASLCTDGCTYLFGGFTVAQIISGSKTWVSEFFTSTHVAFTHVLTVGDAIEVVRYDFLPITWPANIPVSACTFSFNGDACLCERYYCDASQSTTGERIDCSGLEGGSVIEVCNAPSLTTELSRMELLFWLPILFCDGDTGSADGSGTPAVEEALSASGGKENSKSSDEEDVVGGDGDGDVAGKTSDAANTSNNGIEASSLVAGSLSLVAILYYL